MATVYSGMIVYQRYDDYTVNPSESTTYYTSLSGSSIPYYMRGGTTWTISDTGVLTISPIIEGSGEDATLSGVRGAIVMEHYENALTTAQKNAVKTINMSSAFTKANSTRLYYSFFPNLTTIDSSSFPSTCYMVDMSSAFEGLTKLTSITIKSGVAPTNARRMCYGCTGLIRADLSIANLSSMTSAQYMFYNCTSLANIWFPTSNTPFSSCTSMYGMFWGCTKLSGIGNWGSLVTSSVTDMGYLFHDCTSLTSLSITSMNTGNVTSARDMFSGCTALKSITLGSSCTFARNTNFLYMFSNCTSLETISGIGYMQIASATNLSYMFYGCSNLTTAITFSGTGNSSATTLHSMFSGCSKIPSINLGTATFAQATDLSFMFRNCSSVTSISMGSVTAPQCTTTESMFENCSAMTSLSMGSLSTGNVTNMYLMFRGCSSLPSINLSSFSTGNVTNMAGMFWGCSSATTINVSSFDTSKVTRMSSMFRECTALTSLDLSGFSSAALLQTAVMFYKDTNLTNVTFGSSFGCSSVTLMNEMFRKCSSLTSLDLRYFTPTNCTTFASMFSDCGELTQTGITQNFDTSSATTMAFMFARCYKLAYVDLSGFDTSKVTTMQSMFDSNYVLSGIDISGFNTEKVENMSYMFFKCKAITSLRVNNFNTARVTSFAHMFEETSVSQLSLSNFVTLNATSMKGMFQNCANLTSLDLASFRTPDVADMEDMFRDTLRLETVTLGAYFSTESLSTTASKQLGFAPATNTRTTTSVIDDIDFVNLTTLDKEGVWNRAVVNAFDATAYRSSGGYAEETGEDVTFHVRWVTSAVTADRTITIYKRLSYIPIFPTEPEIVVEVEGNAGVQDITLQNVGRDAYDFRVEFYDGTDTYFSFPAVDSTQQIFVITPEGDIWLGLNTDATYGDDYDLYYAITSLGWDDAENDDTVIVPQRETSNGNT